VPVNLPTREDLFQIGAQEVFARGSVRPARSRVSPEAVFTEGTDINIILAACSAMGDEALRHLALRIAALFLDSAEGEDLDRLVADRFSPTIVRRQPSQAVVELSFSRPIPPSSGAPISYAVGRKFRTEQGTEFQLLEPVSFPLNSTGPQTGAAIATLAGADGNVEAGTITQFVVASEDAAVVVTNPAVAAGGSNRETDDSLKERARDFFRTVQKATLPALEFGALTVDGVESATAVEILGNETPVPLPTGDVLLYIADAQGRGNAQLTAAVLNALREFRAGGNPVTVISSTPRFEPIDYQIAFAAGTDTRAAANQLKALTVAAVNLLAPQETLLRSLLFALARSIPGAIVPAGAIVTPAGDVVPNSGQVIKTRLDLVTVNGA
jgi:hypothetical protein